MQMFVISWNSEPSVHTTHYAGTVCPDSISREARQMSPFLHSNNLAVSEIMRRSHVFHIHFEIREIPSVSCIMCPYMETMVKLRDCSITHRSY